jgi:hypothetical protein
MGHNARDYCVVAFVSPIGPKEAMADFLRLLGFALTGAALFAGVGVLFGALAGALARIAGRAPGGLPGNRVAHALGRQVDDDPAPHWTGAIVGAVDGALFLAVIGFVVGAILGPREPGRGIELLRIPLVAVLGLAIGALLLGGLACVLTWGGVRAVGALFGILAGAAVGAILNSRANLDHGTLYGVLGGGLLAILAAFWPTAAWHADQEGSASRQEDTRPDEIEM